MHAGRAKDGCSPYVKLDMEYVTPIATDQIASGPVQAKLVAER